MTQGRPARAVPTPARYTRGMSDPAVLSPEAIIAAVRQLGPDEQLDVYLAIREALPALVTGSDDEGDAGFEASDAFRQELEARYARLMANPESAITLEAFEEELKARFGED